MARTLDYFIALNSPWTYMGSARLGAIVRDTATPITVRPIKLGSILEQTGGLPLPKRSPQRQAYRLQELARWRDHLGLPITLQPAHFPYDESKAALAVIAAQIQGHDALTLATRFGKALWEEEKNLADPATLRAVIDDTGLDASALLAAADTPEMAAQWQANTDMALQVGVFGVPTYKVGDQLYWGQDRLDFVARALA